MSKIMRTYKDKLTSTYTMKVQGRRKQKEGYEYALNKGTYYTVAKNFINSIEKLYPN